MSTDFGTDPSDCGSLPKMVALLFRDGLFSKTQTLESGKKASPDMFPRDNPFSTLF